MTGYWARFKEVTQWRRYKKIGVVLTVFSVIIAYITMKLTLKGILSLHNFFYINAFLVTMGVLLIFRDWEELKGI